MHRIKMVSDLWSLMDIVKYGDFSLPLQDTKQKNL